jgi:hypothetical protein
MSKLASKVVEQAKAWLGCKESNGTHKEIIDVYNSHKPLARGYKVKYTDAWCATFVSAVAIKLGYTDIIPTECGCEKMVNLFKGINSWDESDARVPNPGDVIFYDWDDSGSGDNRGSSDHVGIVEKVAGNKITVIEGNYSNAVKRRTLDINGKYIRGYGVPKYDQETVTPAAPAKEKISVIYQTWDDVKNAWLPNVKDREDYAGIFGHDVCAIYANLTKGDITYQVHYKGGKWLPAVKNRSDYAGLYNKPIDGLMMKTNTGKKIYYRVHLRRTGRWLPFVTGYSTSDHNNGYAGILGQEIDAVEIYLA